MTKLIILLVVFIPVLAFSQNVAINNDGSEPHASALLDISSTEKGVLFPRLTTFERTGIDEPAIGLTVFDTDTYNFWVYRGEIYGGWVELMNSFDKLWNKVGTHMYSTNSGNVGIGTNYPASKLTINDIDPVLAMMNNGLATGYLQAKGFDMRINTHPDNVLGKIILGTKENDHFFIDHIGRVSIGTPSSSYALTINGSDPKLQMQHQNINKGYLQVDDHDLILGTNVLNLSGDLNFKTKDVSRMVIDPNGDVGIGITNPLAKLDVSTTASGQALKLNAADQTFMGFWENNGYRGYVGSYYGNIADMDLGSLAGAVHLVTGSSIDLTAKSGLIGIGTVDPERKLDIYNSTGEAIVRLNSANYDAGIDLVRAGGACWRIANDYDTDYLTFVHADNIAINPRSTAYEFHPTFFRPGYDAIISLGQAQNRWSTVYATNGTINTSDARDKTNIQNINYGLADIMKLRPVSFDWIGKPQWGTKLGLIAQEVKDVVSEVVVHGNIDPEYDKDGNLLPNPDKFGIYYSDLIPVLIKATQEQQQMIIEMKKEIEELKKLREK
ncbi:MAG: tail fiber domain-containing protein [Saprospiraceae bacterium]|nr:tail fiber domain-containing protein [Saprospiraceae bacterium]